MQSFKYSVQLKQVKCFACLTATYIICRQLYKSLVNKNKYILQEAFIPMRYTSSLHYGRICCIYATNDYTFNKHSKVTTATIGYVVAVNIPDHTGV